MNSLINVVSSSFLLRRLALDKNLYKGARTLFNAQYLSMDVYEQAREQRRRSLGPMTENFLNRMRQQVKNPTQSSMVFTEDLKMVMFLANDNEEDLDLVKQMIQKFHSQNRELRFGTFVFGPVVMRLLYYLKKPDLMLELMTDEEVGPFFDQIRSYLIAMDLLYEEQRYQDVLDLNERLGSKQLIDSKYPRDNVLLAMAACYKLNTQESFDYAVSIVKHARESGVHLVRRALHFTIALCLNQGKPDIAMELLSNLMTSNYITNHNLKIMTYVKLGRLQDALDVIRNKVQQDVPVQSIVRGDICQQSLDMLKEAVEASDNIEFKQVLEQYTGSLQQIGAITQDTIDGLLSVAIEPRRDRGFDRFGDNRFGGDRFGGERFGGDRYGGDRFGGDRYGGDRYGGDRYGGDRYGDRDGGDRYNRDNREPFMRTRRPFLPPRQKEFSSIMSE